LPTFEYEHAASVVGDHSNPQSSSTSREVRSTPLQERVQFGGRNFYFRRQEKTFADVVQGICMSAVAVYAEGVGKQFHIGQLRRGHKTFDRGHAFCS
jgi:hypothetical protein